MRTYSLAALMICVAATVACGSHGAASTGDDQNVTAATPASAPITLQNFLNHPKIKAVRDEVQLIDSPDFQADLEGEKDKDGCEASFKIFLGNHSLVVKVIEASGEGNTDEEIQAYYRFRDDLTGSTLRFILKTDKPHGGIVTESRVYFDEQGNKIFQVVRNQGGPDHLPQGNEVFQPEPLLVNPDKLFDPAGGC
jgi:hypothetical protein